jgi:GNAT superfamily N-acetyltransferase
MITIESAGIPGPFVAEYAAVPMAFDVTSHLVATRAGAHEPFVLIERPVHRSYVKDYDAIGDRPADWPRRFDTSQWTMFLARVEGRCCAGAVVAARTPGLDLLDGRDDLALLWDIRVAPANRRQGVGRSLVEAVEAWARARRCRELKVETQNINVGACRFYARQGLTLRTVREGAYPQCPGEAQLLWYKAVDPERD